MSRICYAHSGNKTDKSDWQLLSDHLTKVGNIAAENARYFDAYIVAGHPAGLANGIDFGMNRSTLVDRLKKQFQN